MREILFRAKKTGSREWIEGFVVSHSMETMCLFVEKKSRETWYVDDDTVGQYTGLTDKNGKKIFEGDIVVSDHTLRTYTWSEIPETYKPRRSHSCWWDKKRDEMHYKRNYAVEWKAKDSRWILRNGSDQHDLTSNHLYNHNGEVIGNIHDNPELLKGGVGK